MLQDEDSLLSTSASYSHLSDDKAELLRMLEEASCSSSSSSAGESEEEEAEEEDDDEEEISKFESTAISYFTPSQICIFEDQQYYSPVGKDLVKLFRFF